MKTAKIYKYARSKKFDIQEAVDMQKPFVIELDNEILKTKGGLLMRFESYEAAENRLITVVNEKIKEMQAM